MIKSFEDKVLQSKIDIYISLLKKLCVIENKLKEYGLVIRIEPMIET